MSAFVTHAGHKAYVTHAGHKAFVLHGEAPPVPGTLDVSFSVTNRGATDATQPIVSIGHPFARGDVPAGSRLALFQSDGTTVVPVQQDSESYWSDGSLKFAVISFRAPHNILTGTTRVYRLKSEIGAPDRNPGSNTLANLLATCDPRIEFSTKTLHILCSQIVAGGRVSPAYGANPIDGYEVVKAGPICCEWRFWSYLRRNSDNAVHAWVKAMVWVRKWAAGGIQITGLVMQPNSWGPHPSGTVEVNGGQPPMFSDIITLTNAIGGATLGVWGGPTDPASVLINASAFDVANGWIDLSGTNIQNTQGVTLSGTGRPSALTAPLYWVSRNDSGFTGLSVIRGYAYTEARRSDFTTWLPSHAYSPNDIVRNGSARYYCFTGGTSAASGGPTGATFGATIPDGSCVWGALTAPFGTAGTGTCRVSPMPCVYLHTSVTLADQNAMPFWVGAGAQPQLVPKFDLAYLFQTSRMFLPLDPTITSFPYSPTPDKLHYNVMQFEADIAHTGDNPDDDRIGYINWTSQNALLTDDAGWAQQIRVGCLAWTDWWVSYEDELTGHWITTNNGSNGAGLAYPNLGAPHPQSCAQINPALTFGLLAFPPASDAKSGYDARYDMGGSEGSHCPVLWPVPYLQTGHGIYLYLGINQACANQVSFQFRTGTYGATTYYGTTTNDTGSQVRTVAWGTRCLGMGVHVCPANQPIAPMLRDCLRDSAALLAAYTTSSSIPANQFALGMWPVDWSGVTWQLSFCVESFATEALKGEYPGWLTFLQYEAKWSVALYDASVGGSPYWLATTQVTGRPNTGGLNPTVDTPAEAWSATYPGATAGADGIAQDGPPFNPSTDIVTSFPWSTNARYAINRAAVIMLAHLGIPRAIAILPDIENRFTDAGGITWSGSGGGFIAAAYMTHAIKLP